MPEKILGTERESLEGPATIVHQGGDNILIAEVEGGLPKVEHTLVFEGNEVVIEGDDEFQPSPEADRSYEVEGTVLIRSLGQANYNLIEEPDAGPEPNVEPNVEPPKKPAAKKKAKSAE